MKKHILLLALMAVACTAWAIPAKPGLAKVQQPDGSHVTIQLVGDEYLNFRTTSDGYTVVENSQGFLVYAQLKNGQLSATKQVAHDADQRDAAERAFLMGMPKRLTPDMTEPMATERAREMERRQATLLSRRNAQAGGSRKSAQYDYNNFRGLVILVEYNDRSFSRDDYAELMDSMINQRGFAGYTSYDQNGEEHFEACTGSVRDYFYDNSMTQFDPQFDVVGPVKVSRSQYYPKQSNNANQLFTEAVQAADSLVDFSLYDGDNDGQVDMIFFIVAGGGSHVQTNDQRLLWPHASSFWSTRRYDGKRLGRYACSVELSGAADAPNLDGIGVICHEFSHVLGLMDLYDADYDGSGGESTTPGIWSLMAAGGYLNDSRTPCGYTFYERYAVGFALPQPLNETGSYTLESLSESNQGYKMDTKQKREFFLFENRQRTKWNQYLPGHGLMVYRVDSTSTSVWTGNRVNNNPKHNYFELLRAGGGTNDSASDPFPGSRGVTELSNLTTANLLTWAGYESDLILTNISESNGVISFDVEEPKVYDTVEDFESCDSIGQTDQGYTILSGRYCQWQLIGTQLAEPGEDNCNGQKAIAFGQNTALRSSEIQQQVNRILMTVYNPNSTSARLQAYKTNSSGKWEELSGLNNNATGGVSANSSGVLMFDVDWSNPCAYQFIKRTGNVTFYMDDLIFDFDDAIPDAIRDVRAQPSATGRPQFYDLSGRRVDESQLKGGVYIMKDGNRTRKIMTR